MEMECTKEAGFSEYFLSDNNLLSDEIELNIFPNPSTDFINLSFKSNSDYRWVMYNELGSIVNQSRTKKSNGKTVELINTSDLKSGYLFYVNNN